VIVLGSELGDELLRRRLGGIDLPELAHFSITTALCNRHCITQFRRINSDESFAMMPHDSPSMYEALPGPIRATLDATSRVSRLICGGGHTVYPSTPCVYLLPSTR
jgi:hypothetical protein